MAIDQIDLQQVLSEAIAEYQADRNRAVRGGRFIGPVHRWCARELSRQGLPQDNLVPHPRLEGYLRPSSQSAIDESKRRIRSRLRGKQNAQLREQLMLDLDSVSQETRRSRLRVQGGYLEKEIDVGLMVEDTGPLLAVSVKSQMSSIAKNAINRFEEYVGDATNLHTRYPMLALGFLLIVPVSAETVLPDTAQPTELLRRIEGLLAQATGRESPSGATGSYEASALVLVDFESDPPTVRGDFPAAGSELRVEGFFDRLAAIYGRRNRRF